jgi:hypothetical protein
MCALCVVGFIGSIGYSTNLHESWTTMHGGGMATAAIHGSHARRAALSSFERESGANGFAQDGSVSVSPTRRIVLATIPRSGNGWIRGMLEGSTAVATASVYPETGATFVDRIGAFSTACGWLADCEWVRQPVHVPVVIKVRVFHCYPSPGVTTPAE